MTTTTNTLPPPVQQHFNEKLLSTPMPHLIYNMFAIPKTMPANSGDIVRMRRYNKLNTFEAPLNPLFLNPPAQQLTAVDVDAQVYWYGTYIILTRQVTAINEDPVLNAAAARLSQALRETEDKLMRTLLESSASFVNCVGGVNGGIAVLKSSLIDLELQAA